jgi:hypothetical protein
VTLSKHGTHYGLRWSGFPYYSMTTPIEMAPSISHQARTEQLCVFVPCGSPPVHINWNGIYIWTKIWGQHLVNLYFFPIHEHLSSPTVFDGFGSIHLFSCCVVLICFNVLFCMSSSCVVCAQMLPLSLDCQFLIAPSSFSNVYSSLM